MWFKDALIIFHLNNSTFIAVNPPTLDTFVSIPSQKSENLFRLVSDSGLILVNTVYSYDG